MSHIHQLLKLEIALLFRLQQFPFLLGGHSLFTLILLTRPIRINCGILETAPVPISGSEAKVNCALLAKLETQVAIRDSVILLHHLLK